MEHKGNTYVQELDKHVKERGHLGTCTIVHSTCMHVIMYILRPRNNNMIRTIALQ